MIQPETKWPEVYAAISTERLIDIFEAAPQRIRRVLEGLKGDDLLYRPAPGQWSVREVVMHVCDAEIMAAARVRQIFAEPGSQFSIYNQDVWARAFAYQEFDENTFRKALTMFDHLRFLGCRIFRAASADDWEKTGIHPERGPVTLRQILELYADHSERHILQILALRQKMGKPMHFPVFLEKRLY